MKIRIALISSVAVIAVLPATSGFAQSVPPAAVAPADPAQAGPTEGIVTSQQSSAEATPNTEQAQDIVVTGSRTIRDGNAAPTPVTTLTSAALTQTAPSNIPDALNRLPQFLGSASQYRSVTFNATGGLQGNYLNLRGLGPQRVLVLLDGNRVPPTSSSNAVDSNVIPQMLIERVDVVTGGASAAYGSDAVSGVVNYVLDKRFTGVRAQAQKSISTYGDAPAYRLGIAAGTGFSDGKGHIEFSAEQYENDGIPRQSDRGLYAGRPLIVGSGAAANPYTQVGNTAFNDVTFGGLIRSGPLAGNSFNPDGTVSPFVTGTPTGTSNVVSGGQGAFQPPTVLVPRLETKQAFGRLSYDFSDSLAFFVQGSYARTETGYLSAFANRRAGSSNGTTIFADNPYLSPGIRTTLGATPSFTISRFFSDAPGNEQTAVTKSYNIQTGLSGKIGESSLRWDVNYIHGNARLDLTQVEQNNRNYYASVDAVRGANGQIVCGVTVRNPTLLPGCVPVNILGTGNLDPAALAFIRQTSRSRIENTLDVVAANLRGDLFELPAGPVAFAVGGEMRWQKLSQGSNADPAVAVDYSGIRGIPAGVLPFATTNVGAARGSQTVKEAYGELNVPLLRDVGFARRLELNGAVRYTEYKTSGSVETWKVGGIYEPFDGLRLRATRSRDIAAPSLFDLFAGPQAQIGTNTDRLTGVTALSTIITAGNADLQPEKADTLVGGVVFTPTFIPRLSLSVDAYRIKINDAIGTVSSQDELNDCHTSGGTAPVCALITRPFPYTNTTAANFPTQIIVSPQNLSQVTVKGIDFEANYAIPLDGLIGLDGTLTLRGFVSYLDTYDTKPSVNAAVVQRAGTVVATGTTAGLPKWRGLLQQSYTGGGLTVQVSERFTGSYRRTANEAFDPAFANAPNRTYTDLYIAQAVGEKDMFSLFLQVDNLFNVKPPLLPATVNPGFTYPTDKTLYDVLGRNFTVGAKLRF